MTLVLEVVWPETLPLPYIDFRGNPHYSTLVSPPKLMAAIRRSRHERSYNTLTVTWVLTGSQYAAFKAFHKTDLGNGAAHFKLELKYPKDTELTAWEVSFSGGFAATYNDGLWQVEAVLHLVNPVEF